MCILNSQTSIADAVNGSFLITVSIIGGDSKTVNLGSGGPKTAGRAAELAGVTGNPQLRVRGAPVDGGRVLTNGEEVEVLETQSGA